MVWGIRGVGSDGKIGMGWGSWGVDMVGYVCGWNWNNKLLFYLHDQIPFVLFLCPFHPKSAL